MATNNQKGFALTEALVAATISASVFAACVSLLSGVSRLTARTHKLNEIAEEARLISARLDANVDDAQLLQGLEDWRLTTSPYQLSSPGERSLSLYLVYYKFTHVDAPAIVLERIAARGAN